MIYTRRISPAVINAKSFTGVNNVLGDDNSPRLPSVSVTTVCLSDRNIFPREGCLSDVKTRRCRVHLIKEMLVL